VSTFPVSNYAVSLADITAPRPATCLRVCPRESRFSTHTRPLLWTRYPPHFIFHHPSSTTSFDSTRSGTRRQQDRSERFTGGQFSEGSLHLESPVSHTSHVGRTDGRTDGQTDRRTDIPRLERGVNTPLSVNRASRILDSSRWLRFTTPDAFWSVSRSSGQR